MRTLGAGVLTNAPRGAAVRSRAAVVVAVVMAAVAAVACRERPPPPSPPASDAGPRVEAEPLDCRTHRANPDTGEVRRVAPPFARLDVEAGAAVLREGGHETFRVALDAPGAAAAAGARGGVVFAHVVVALSGGRLHALDRETGKATWGRATHATSLLALPGDLALAVGPGARGAGLAVAHRGKTGEEAFRVALPAGAAEGGGQVADRRYVVFTTARPGGGERLLLIDPPLAKGVVGPASPAWRELDLASPRVGTGVFSLRAAPGALFVATRRELLRLGDGGPGAKGDVAWRKEVPFAGATALTVLDVEEVVYVAALDAARGDEAAVVGYDVKGQDGAEIRELFRATVPLRPGGGASADGGAPGGVTGDGGAAGDGPCEVALGRPDKALVVAWLCGRRSGVALLDPRTGARARLVHASSPPPP